LKYPRGVTVAARFKTSASAAAGECADYQRQRDQHAEPGSLYKLRAFRCCTVLALLTSVLRAEARPNPTAISTKNA
jgi:hypothetical protein